MKGTPDRPGPLFSCHEFLVPTREGPLRSHLAEGVGFEPTMGYEPIAVFKTAALGHYASPPVRRSLVRPSRPAAQMKMAGSAHWLVASRFGKRRTAGMPVATAPLGTSFTTT